MVFRIGFENWIAESSGGLGGLHPKCSTALQDLIAEA
jgi:hypothetical protein